MNLVRTAVNSPIMMPIMAPPRLTVKNDTKPSTIYNKKIMENEGENHSPRLSESIDHVTFVYNYKCDLVHSLASLAGKILHWSYGKFDFQHER